MASSTRSGGGAMAARRGLDLVLVRIGERRNGETVRERRRLALSLVGLVYS